MTAGPERGTWLLASIVTGRRIALDDPYPHVHQDPQCGRKGCAACGDVTPDDAGPVRHGNDGHACGPANRGTTGRNWTCPECGADWIVIQQTRAGVQTRTWERA